MWFVFIELGILALIAGIVIWAIRSKPKDNSDDDDKPPG